jgi:hypothetical protein
MRRAPPQGQRQHLGVGAAATLVAAGLFLSLGGALAWVTVAGERKAERAEAWVAAEAGWLETAAFSVELAPRSAAAQGELVSRLRAFGSLSLNRYAAAHALFVSTRRAARRSARALDSERASESQGR